MAFTRSESPVFSEGGAITTPFSTTWAASTGVRRLILEIRVHLSAPGSGGNFVAEVDSVRGATYDYVMRRQDMTGITDIAWTAETDGLRVLEIGDALNLTWPVGAGETGTWAVLYRKEG